MHKVSLIVSTLGERQQDLRNLLNSLCRQAEYISEVVLVDQHAVPTALCAIVEEFSTRLPIIHTRCEKGLSRARNHGMSFAKGAIVAFPDDDCMYSDGLLEYVTEWFDRNFEYDILAVGARDETGELSGNRWPQDRCDIRAFNAFRTTFSSTLFIWGDLARSSSFDREIGLGSGTPFGSGEETDFVLGLLGTAGARGRFDRSRFIVHPRRDMFSGSGSLQRAEAYGIGMGHVLRKNSLPLLWTSFMTYNLLRAGVALLSGNQTVAKMCTAQTRGLRDGFLGRGNALWPLPSSGSGNLPVLKPAGYTGNTTTE